MKTLIIIQDPTDQECYIANFTGETGMGETVEEQEAHGITGENKRDVIYNACSIWGIFPEECNIEF